MCADRRVLPLVRPVHIGVITVMTALQIEQALLRAAPQERVVLAARLIAIALVDDDVLNPVPPGAAHDSGATGDAGSQR